MRLAGRDLFAHRFDGKSSLLVTATRLTPANQSGYLPRFRKCDTQSVSFASQTNENPRLECFASNAPDGCFRFSCELIILPLLSTLVNHTKTILVQNLVFCMISRDSGMQCSGFVIPLMCKILNRVWLRNYIGLHSSVTTPRKSLPPQLIGLGHCPTQFRTGNPTFHETHTLSISVFTPSSRRKKHLGTYNSSSSLLVTLFFPVT